MTSISAAREKGSSSKSQSARHPSGGDAAPAIVIFGKDEGGKAHAAWFVAVDAEAAERAAGYMKLRALRVSTPEHRALAQEAPLGRIFESGKAFAPFAKMALYDRLSATEGVFDPPAPPEPEPVATLAATDVPRTWADIRAGSLVLASADVDDGWWPAIIAEARGEDLFVLRWQGWADEPPFVRRGADLGLMPPSAVLPPGADHATAEA